MQFLNELVACGVLRAEELVRILVPEREEAYTRCWVSSGLSLPAQMYVLAARVEVAIFCSEAFASWKEGIHIFVRFSYSFFFFFLMV